MGSDILVKKTSHIYTPINRTRNPISEHVDHN